MTTPFQLVDSLDDIPNHDALLDDLDARAEWYAERQEDDPDAEADEYDNFND